MKNNCEKCETDLISMDRYTYFLGLFFCPKCSESGENK